MMKTKLKPCPFCGSDDLDLMETDSGVGGLEGGYYVTCWCCDHHQSVSRCPHASNLKEDGQ